MNNGFVKSLIADVFVKVQNMPKLYFALLNKASAVEVCRCSRLWRTRVRRKGSLIDVQLRGQ